MISRFSRVCHQKRVSTPATAKLSQAMAALAGTTIAGFCSLASALPINAAMVANYQFQNTLSSTIATAPDLVPFAFGTYIPVSIGGTPTTAYKFGKNEGLSLNTTGLISDNYTIAALFSFDDISGWRKILDYKNLTSDNELYIFNGQLYFYPVANGGPIVSPGTFLETVLTRNSTINLVTAYFDGTPVFSFTDSTPYGVISVANILNIFQDDFITAGSESSSGSVAGIRIFNHVLTDAEVANLNLITPVPGPLPLFGFAAAFGWSRSLRRRLRNSSATA